MQKRSQSGVAIVEFALILPFLLLLIFTTTEFGRALYEYQAVAKSVREAARYLTTQNPNSPAAIAASQNLIVYGYTQPPPGAAPLAKRLTVANVMTPTWQQVGTAPLIKTVTVGVHDYRFESIFTTVFGIEFGTVTFSDITATMRSHL